MTRQQQISQAVKDKCKLHEEVEKIDLVLFNLKDKRAKTKKLLDESLKRLESLVMQNSEQQVSDILSTDHED